MNSKPKSWAALKKSVEAADIAAMPSAKLGAKRADKLILICIAEAGSDVGVGARPGNALLERASGLRWSQCHEHLVKLEKAGMLKREEAHGRGLASVYRIVWSHPVFPDHSPNWREWFVEKPPVSQEKTSGFDSDKPPVSSQKTSGLESENIRVQGEKHPGLDQKTSGLEAKTSGVRPEHIPIPSEEQPTPSNPTAGGGNSPQTPAATPTLDEWKKHLPEPMRLPFGRHKSKAAAFLKAKGLSMAVGYSRHWCDLRSLLGLNDIWGAFFREAAELEYNEVFRRSLNFPAWEERQQEEMMKQIYEQNKKEDTQRKTDDEEIAETMRMLREAK